MADIAIFYHVRISGGVHPASEHSPAVPGLNHMHAQGVLHEQVHALQKSGLIGNANHFTVGFHGTAVDKSIINRATAGQSELVWHGEDTASEMPTLALVADFSKNNPGYLVFYHHTKGVNWPTGQDGIMRRYWRKCMEKSCVWRWKECVGALESGYDMAGAHWLTGPQYPHAASALAKGIWGGNFFWATSDYLATLPPLKTPYTWENRYWAEMWPASGERTPTVRDFSPHWPGQGPCQIIADQR